MKKIRVFNVDDSALIRQLLARILGSDPEIEIVGSASDPYAAWQRLKTTEVDVLTLDVEMPRMDGLTFLEKLMKAKPMPVLMISSLTEKGAETTLRALELGAIDFVTKPKIDVHSGTVELADEIISKVKIAARANVSSARRAAATRASAPLRVSDALLKSTNQVIAIGASTGGTEALYSVLTALPATSPGIVIVQHMPPRFTKSFADRLNAACRIEVKEAEDGDRILPGRALLAPGDFHMEVVRSGADYRVRIFSADPVNRFRPSVDVLFHSCAKYLGRNVVGVILTGMGYDGAKGMLAMHKAGARTIAQDEESCVVFGMPREAILAGGVDQVVSLSEVAATMLNASERVPV